MRIVAILCAALGVAGSGFLGVKWLSDINEKKKELEVLRQVEAAGNNEKLTNDMKELDRIIRTGYGLVGGAVLGVVGIVLLLMHLPKIAALVFLIGFGAPIALLLDGKVVIFTFGLALAALFALLVRPRVAAFRDRRGGYA